jgi:aspartyl-tRNA(Asn)/glutamyl-tRNA(Gln) amidotransferase subunit C
VNLAPQDLEKLARLSRLAISEKEGQELLPALGAIVDWVGELSLAPTDGVLPMAHPHDLALRLRDDTPQALPPREALLKSAPLVAEGLFLVPRVVE